MYSAPLYLGNVVQFLNYRLDVYFVHGVVGLPAVGAYTVAVGLAQLLWLLPNAVSAPVLRAAAQPHSGPDLAAFVAQVNRMCLWTCALGGAALCAMAGPMLALVFGAEFAASRTPLLVLVPGVVLFAPTVVLSAYLGGVRRQVWTTWVACAAVVVTVVGNVLLVPRIGTAGAALASTVSYTASSAATLFLVVRHGRGFTLGALLLPRAADVRAAARLLRGAR